MTERIHDIVDTANANGSFTTLVAAVTAAGLVESLKGDGPFTVFAPTDEAFAALPAGTVEKLVQPEQREALTALLLLHVLPGAVHSRDVAGQSLRPASAGGELLDIDGNDGVTVNGARVTTADIECTNGVIHVIDRVLQL
ncbi:MAG: fasciclin domain-containing protein, partial [Sphingomonas bacterium]|nr:fasciclin domain-containing protein [Sphingomonas bacterium]